MNVKRYIAETAALGLEKVKRELGRDAVILSTRKIKKKGIVGIFSKPVYEVVAAYEDRKQPVKRAVPKPPLPVVPDMANRAALESLENKINGLAGAIDEVMSGIKTKAPERGEIDDLVDVLIENEVHAELAKQIGAEAKERMAREGGTLREGMRRELLRYFADNSFRPLNPAKREVALFMGPTGVGKTTTLAKLAALSSLKEGRSVGVITADTYRIAAVEQLKTYAEILDVPVGVIYKNDEAPAIIESYADKDMIYVDTAGKSPNDKDHCADINELIKYAGATEVYLVISATVGFRGCMNIIENYKAIGDFKLIFTKLDETPAAGMLLNAAHYSGKSISFLTTGQNVPDDIEIMDAEKIVDRLMGTAD